MTPNYIHTYIFYKIEDLTINSFGAKSVETRPTANISLINTHPCNITLK